MALKFVSCPWTSQSIAKIPAPKTQRIIVPANWIPSHHGLWMEAARLDAFTMEWAVAAWTTSIGAQASRFPRRCIPSTTRRISGRIASGNKSVISSGLIIVLIWKDVIKQWGESLGNFVHGVEQRDLLKRRFGHLWNWQPDILPIGRQRSQVEDTDNVRYCL